MTASLDPQGSSLGNPTVSGPLALASVVVFALLVAATGYRVVSEFNTPVARQFDWQRLGYCDFHVAVYYASKAYREGINPFSAEVIEHYPFERELPLHSPLMLILHAPLTFVSNTVAAAIHFVFNLSLVLCLAWLALKCARFPFRWPHVLLAASFILLTRCGHVTMFTGYITTELVIGTALALHYGNSRPWLGGLGLVVAGFKPTYAIPLVFLMLCRKQWMAAGIGVAGSLIGLTVGFGWLAMHSSWSDVIASVGSTQEVHVAQESEMPVNSWTRIDLLAMVAKWTNQNPTSLFHLVAMAPLLLIGGLAVARLNRIQVSRNAASISGMLAVVTLLISVYHHVYDCLLLIVPLAGLLFARLEDWQSISKTCRWVIGGLVLSILFSYWSSGLVLDQLSLPDWGRRLVTSGNGVLLLGLFVTLIWESLRLPVGTGTESTGTEGDGETDRFRT